MFPKSKMTILTMTTLTMLYEKKDAVDSPMTYVLSYLCCRVDLGLLGNIIIFIMQSYKIIL